jgi:hypothetical protein
MSKINDIFDLPDQTETPKKERKKTVMTDEKKNALLERLAKGRETRANNLLAKKGLPPKTEEKTEGYKEQVKDKRIESIKNDDKQPKTESKAQPKAQPKVDNSEDERKAFINTMVGKSKPVEKFERPKKKVYDEQPKQIIIEAPKVEAPKVEAPKKQSLIEAPKKQSLIEAPKKPEGYERPKKTEGYAPPKVVAPVVFSTLKKPMWG